MLYNPLDLLGSTVFSTLYVGIAVGMLYKLTESEVGIAVGVLQELKFNF